MTTSTGAASPSLAPFVLLLRHQDDLRTVFTRQWLICIGTALSVIVASEIRKALRRRNHPRMGDDTPSPAGQHVGT